MENINSDAEYYGKIAYEIHRGSNESGLAWEKLSEEERQSWISVGGWISDIQSPEETIIEDIIAKIQSGDLNETAIIRGVENWMREIENEPWVFLANAAFVESAKDAIRHLIAVIQYRNNNGGEAKPVEDSFVQDTSEVVTNMTSPAGNFVGKTVEFPVFGTGTITDILPPKSEGEIERIRVKFEDGKIGEFGFRPYIGSQNVDFVQ